LQPPHEHGLVLVSADTRPGPCTSAALRLQASLSTWTGVFASLPEKMPVRFPRIAARETVPTHRACPLPVEELLMRPATVQLIDLGLDWSFDHSMAFAASLLQSINVDWEHPAAEVQFIRTKDLDTVAAALAADSEITHVMAHGVKELDGQVAFVSETDRPNSTSASWRNDCRTAGPRSARPCCSPTAATRPDVPSNARSATPSDSRSSTWAERPSTGTTRRRSGRRSTLPTFVTRAKVSIHSAAARTPPSEPWPATGNCWSGRLPTCTSDWRRAGRRDEPSAESRPRLASPPNLGRLRPGPVSPTASGQHQCPVSVNLAFLGACAVFVFPAEHPAHHVEDT
jgi:hypothetical protein